MLLNFDSTFLTKSKNELGKPSSSGLYIIKMTAKSMEDSEWFTKAQKVVLLK